MIKVKTTILIIFALMGVFDTFCQNHKYLFLLKDKQNSLFTSQKPLDFLSPRAVERRKKQRIKITEQDFPVNPNYIKDIQNQGATIWYSSRWINGVMAECDSATAQKIISLPFVKGIELNTYLESPKDKGIIAGDTPPIAISFLQFPSTPNADTIKYGDSNNQLEMLGIDKLHQKGYRGEGMLIAVLDDGFKNADRVPYLKSIFEEKRILATYNFVKKKSQVYEDGGHGTSVLSCIATDVNGKLYGSAYKSTFVLLKTEKLEDESVQEEANILFALEYADSLGVDVVNISLGYGLMDNPLTSYSQAKRNGFTSLSARAVNWASTKGMIAVVAAGNSGQTSDKLIMTPADADSALTVGGVDAVKNIYTKSSIGPRIDGITKPDLMAKGVATVLGGLLGNIATGSGTSYASPLMAGLVATFWQQNPTFTAAQIKNALKKSGDKYLNPSSQFGFGIPSPDSALKFLVPLPPEILGLENRNNLKLNISPNPFDNFTLPKLDFVSNKKNCLAIIYNSKGEIVWQNIVQNNNDILKLENLSAGQYVLKITDGSSFGIKKITKIN